MTTSIININRLSKFIGINPEHPMVSYILFIRGGHKYYLVLHSLIKTGHDSYSIDPNIINNIIFDEQSSKMTSNDLLYMISGCMAVEGLPFNPKKARLFIGLRFKEAP